MLTVIFKSLHNCNLRCSYCSVGEKTESRVITKDGLTRAMVYAGKEAVRRGETHLNLLLHGGEPMLIPCEWYICGYEAIEEAYPHLKKRFCIQTNGTILTPEYLKFFQNYNVRVGISLDGPKDVHDAQRRDIHNHGTYNQIMKNISVLQQAGIQVATLMVLTKPALNLGFDYIKDFANQKLPIKINPMLSMGEANGHDELVLDAGDYASYLIRLFYYLLENQVEVSVRPLENLLRAAIYGTRPAGCTFDAKCHERFLCVDSEERLYPCGRFADMGLFSIGTLQDGITREGQSRIQTLLQRRRLGSDKACLNCNAYRICSGGCSAWGYLVNTYDMVTPLCQDIQMLWDFFQKDGLSKYRLYLTQERDRLLRKRKEMEQL